QNELVRIDVEKSASHQQSQTEIDSGNPCSQHLSPGTVRPPLRIRFGQTKMLRWATLFHMSRFPRSIRIVFAVFILFSRTYSCLAQSTAVTGTQENAAVLTRLSPPVYPPIALTAR